MNMSHEAIMDNFNNDSIKAIFKGISFELLSDIPFVKLFIAGYEAWKKDVSDRRFLNLINDLQRKVSDIKLLFSNDWLNTNEGRLFIYKAFEYALEAHNEEKLDFFTNALINGIEDTNTDNLKKSKFLDILDNLSFSSLLILSDIHNKHKDKVINPGNGPYPIISKNDIASDLSEKYEPYMVISSMYELEANGLFSNIAEWRHENNKHIPAGGFKT